jgi:hypothetical protein
MSFRIYQLGERADSQRPLEEDVGRRQRDEFLSYNFLMV